jgi:hypothetical protein
VMQFSINNQIMIIQNPNNMSGTHRLQLIEGSTLNVNNPDPRTTSTSINQRYLESRETKQINKVRRIVDDALTDSKSSSHVYVSKKASSIAATGLLTGKPHISSHDG